MSKRTEKVLGDGTKPSQKGNIAKAAKGELDGLSKDATLPVGQPDTTGAHAPGDDS